jgi:long-subunit acyl-CoA synthetase (AMP-forming)
VILVPKIDRRAILEGLKHKSTIFLGVPALYGLLCLLKPAPLDSVAYFISSGDVLPDKIRIGFELIYRRKLCNDYDLTETAPVLSVDLDDQLRPTNCVGKPLIDVSRSIRDAAWRELPVGTICILWVKGNNVMLEYYYTPEKTAEVLRCG